MAAIRRLMSRIRSSGVCFVFLLPFAACQSAERQPVESLIAGSPVAEAEPRLLTAGESNMLAYLHSIEDALEHAVRHARMVRCDDPHYPSGGESDCFAMERQNRNGGASGFVHDPFDMKEILDDFEDMSSIGLIDYGLMPDETEIWVRLKPSDGGSGAMFEGAVRMKYFRVKLAELQSVEVVPLIPASIFGYRPYTERQFIARFVALPHLKSVGACYGTRTPGKLRAYEVSPNDSAIDLPFGSDSLSCPHIDL